MGFLTEHVSREWRMTTTAPSSAQANSDRNKTNLLCCLNVLPVAGLNYAFYCFLFQDVRKTDPTKNETVVGEHLKFERKDVWDMKWADVSSCEN